MSETMSTAVNLACSALPLDLLPAPPQLHYSEGVRSGLSEPPKRVRNKRDLCARAKMSNLPYSNLSSGLRSEDILVQLALDVNWTLSRAADTLWRRLNPDLWERTHNPWAVLQTVSGQTLKRITSEPAFQTVLNDIVQERSAENEAHRWFQQAHPNSPLTCVAYFSMEYMLSEAL